MHIMSRDKGAYARDRFVDCPNSPLRLGPIKEPMQSPFLPGIMGFATGGWWDSRVRW